MNKFKKLNLPKRHTLQAPPARGEVKWFCSVEGSGVYYLHDDLHIYHGTTTEEHSQHCGYFDSEEKALSAYKNYYYLYGKEPGH